MQERDIRPYELERREVIARTDTLRVSILTLAAGQEVPWHFHSEIADTFFCLDGVLSVETRDPKSHHVLGVGESCAVPAKTAHRVTGRNGGRVRFLIVQGVGVYDYRPAG